MKIEYFVSPTSEPMISINGHVKMIEPDDYDIINDLLNRFEVDYPEAYKMLLDIYGGMAHAKWMMVRRIIRCNFGVYDNIPDQDTDSFFHFEHVSCPLRGECSSENIICNPKFSTNLTKRELEIIAMICSNRTDQQIADQLCVSLFTVQNHRRNIIRKIPATNKQGIADYARKNNLV